MARRTAMVSATLETLTKGRLLDPSTLGLAIDVGAKGKRHPASAINREEVLPPVETVHFEFSGAMPSRCG
jgi:hypothetical protein